jgi:hypothetical protein
MFLLLFLDAPLNCFVFAFLRQLNIDAQEYTNFEVELKLKKLITI